MKVLGMLVVAALTVTTTGCSSDHTSMDHLHTVAVIDGDVIAGSHNGLWRLHESQQPEPLSEVPWDVMGFAHDAQTWFASGHPGPDMAAPANLGVQVSTDGGRTWQGRALVGDVDFHRLSARDGVLAGIDSQSGAVLVSTDNGYSWQAHDLPGARDVFIAPEGPVVLNEQEWIIINEEGVAPVPAPIPGAVTAHAFEQGFLVSTIDGTLWSADTWTGPWRVLADFAEPAFWIGSESSVISVLTPDAVHISRDGGKSFTVAQQ